MELRLLIRWMSMENYFGWGASRIHGELLKLGFEVAQSSVAKYMVKRRSPSQRWRTFLHNHAPDIAAIVAPGKVCPLAPPQVVIAGLRGGSS
jgi:hypothetical protein